MQTTVLYWEIQTVIKKKTHQEMLLFLHHVLCTMSGSWKENHTHEENLKAMNLGFLSLVQEKETQDQTV